MNFVDAAKEIVQIAHDVLIGAHQEKTEVVRFQISVAVGVELMHRQRVAHVAQVNELVDLAVRIAGDVHERGLARGPLVQPRDGHDGKQLSERPMIHSDWNTEKLQRYWSPSESSSLRISSGM